MRHRAPTIVIGMMLCLVLSAGTAAASYPGEQKDVLYVRDGEYDLRAVTLGGAHRTLVKAPPLVVGGRWSPDGSRIVFSGAPEASLEALEIVVANARGRNQRPLTDDDVPDRFPAWSPDGSMIAWMRTRPMGHQLWVMRADGKQKRKVVDLSIPFPLQPGWTPEGKRIVFTDHDGDLEIFTIRPDGTSKRRITNNSRADLFGDWSPDGSRLVIISDRGPGKVARIWTITPDDSRTRRVMDLEDGVAGYNLRWQPDGRFLIFEGIAGGKRDLFRMRPDGSGIRNITKQPGNETLHLITS
jgi:Tol biopolymer transport system component